MQLAVKKALYVNKEGVLSKVSVKNDTRMSEWQVCVGVCVCVCVCV